MDYLKKYTERIDQLSLEINSLEKSSFHENKLLIYKKRKLLNRYNFKVRLLEKNILIVTIKVKAHNLHRIQKLSLLDNLLVLTNHITNLE